MNRRKGGMTLVEVIVAMAIFAIVFLMVFSIVDSASRINSATRQKLNAQEIGVIITEEFQFYASQVYSRDALIGKLDEIVDSLRNLENFDIEDHVQFEYENESRNPLVLNTDSLNVTLRFLQANDLDNTTLSDHQVQISVTYEGQTFETIVWLLYK